VSQKGEYVVKNRRLKNYLYALGFDFKAVPDRYKEDVFIYLFPNNDYLQESISFYDKMHKVHDQVSC
jgi:hypothetical protein